MPDPSVSIIVVNWNNAADTIACVRSCSLLQYDRYDILIVDNGSTDGSIPLLRSAFSDSPLVTVMDTGTNLGFAGGNNVAIQRALDGGASFVWLLNNDTEVEASSLGELVDAALRHPECGMIGSKIYLFDPTDVLWWAGGEVDLSDGHSWHVGEGERDEGQHDEEGPTGYVTGCSLLARADMIRQIGTMSEDYFLYWEEVDWCARAKRAGWASLYAPTSRVWHKVSGSFTGRRGLQLRYEMRNRLIYFSRHDRSRLPGIFVRGAVRTARVLLSRDVTGALGIGRGLADFALGRTGRIGS